MSILDCQIDDALQLHPWWILRKFVNIEMHTASFSIAVWVSFHSARMRDMYVFELADHWIRDREPSHMTSVVKHIIKNYDNN